MNLKRFFRDFLEFLLLCIGTCFGLSQDHHDFGKEGGLFLMILMLMYGAIFLVNLIFQVVLSNTSSSGIELFFKRFKAFALILFFSTIAIGLYLSSEGADLTYFFTIVTGLLLLYFLVINVLLIHKTLFSFSDLTKYIKGNKSIIIYFLVQPIVLIIVSFIYVPKNHDENDWSEAIRYDSEELYSSYINNHPHGIHFEDAIWEKTDKINTLEAYYSYKKKYPNGKYIRDCDFNIARLTRDESLLKSFIEKYPEEYTKDDFKKEAQFLLATKLDSFTDGRDGQIYRCIKIGNQVWMSENIRFASPRSYTYKYGGLYDKTEACKVCPEGWHLPDESEWNELMDIVHYAVYLKSRYGWSVTNGTDAIGFSAEPGGYAIKEFSDKTQSGTPKINIKLDGYRSLWWTITSKNKHTKLNYWQLYDFDDKPNIVIDSSVLFPIRCVKDNKKRL